MRRGDKRFHTVLLTVTGAGLLGLAVSVYHPSTSQVSSRDIRPTPEWVPQRHVREMKSREVDQRFRQAVVMLHARRYDYAIAALHRVLELAPKLPEAHTNMGFALLGQGDYKAAADFFGSAIELRRNQANAYYGLAMVLEAVCDIAGATGAMRTFVHLAESDDAYVRKARAALWEWESTPSAGGAKCDGARKIKAGPESE